MATIVEVKYFNSFMMKKVEKSGTAPTTKSDPVWPGLEWNPFGYPAFPIQASYIGDEGDATEPYAAPLRAVDVSMLPPATIITAEFDVLRDEGEAYGARLREAGVPVSVVRYHGTIHFLLLLADRIQKGQEAINKIAVDLEKAFKADA